MHPFLWLTTLGHLDEDAEQAQYNQDHGYLQPKTMGSFILVQQAIRKSTCLLNGFQLAFR